MHLSLSEYFVLVTYTLKRLWLKGRRYSGKFNYVISFRYRYDYSVFTYQDF